MNSVRSNNLSLKYQRFIPWRCKDIGTRKFEFVAITQFLCISGRNTIMTTAFLEKVKFCSICLMPIKILPCLKNSRKITTFKSQKVMYDIVEMLGLSMFQEACDL